MRDDMAALEVRVAELERRVAALEPTPREKHYRVKGRDAPTKMSAFSEMMLGIVWVNSVGEIPHAAP